MKHDWILDVLADLKAFAQSNDLGGLAKELDDVKRVASLELKALANAETGAAVVYTDKAGELLRDPRRGGNA